MGMGIPKVRNFSGFLLLQCSPFCFSFTVFIEREVRLREDNKEGHLNAWKNEQRRMVEENKQRNGRTKASENIILVSAETGKVGNKVGQIK